MQTIDDTTLYQTLGDIRLRKAQLQTEINKDGSRARRIVDGILHPKPKKQEKGRMSFAGLLSTGAGVVDGALFAWKIYRKFGGGGKGKSFRLFG